MWTDCKKFVLRCVLCARKKPSRHRPSGLLQPFSVPGRPWNSISYRAVTHVSRLTAFLVVIDRLYKEGACIPTTDTNTAPDVEDAFVSHAFSKRGIPLHVSSDHSPLTSSAHSARSFEYTDTSRQVTTLQPTVGGTGQQHLGTVPSYVLHLRAGQRVQGDQPDRYDCAANVSRLSTQVPFINKRIYQRSRRTRSVKSPRFLSRAKSLWCRNWVEMVAFGMPWNSP